MRKENITCASYRCSKCKNLINKGILFKNTHWKEYNKKIDEIVSQDFTNRLYKLMKTIKGRYISFYTLLPQEDRDIAILWLPSGYDIRLVKR